MWPFSKRESAKSADLPTAAADFQWTSLPTLRGVSGPLPEMAVQGYVLRTMGPVSFADFRPGPIPPDREQDCLSAYGLSAMTLDWLDRCDGRHPTHAFFGCLIGKADQPCLSQFVPSSQFVRLLHTTIAMLWSEDVELQQLAVSTKEATNIYLFDARTPHPEGFVPLEDILGCFKVADSAVVAGTYTANERGHQLLTKDGMFQLPSPYLRGLFVWFQKNAVPEGYGSPTPPYQTW